MQSRPIECTTLTSLSLCHRLAERWSDCCGAAVSVVTAPEPQSVCQRLYHGSVVFLVPGLWQTCAQRETTLIHADPTCSFYTAHFTFRLHCIFRNIIKIFKIILVFKNHYIQYTHSTYISTQFIIVDWLNWSKRKLLYFF